MKKLVLFLVLFLFSVGAYAQLGNISKLPLDTVFSANSFVPGVDTTGASKKPYSFRVKDIVKHGAAGNFKTIGDSSIIGTGDIPVRTVSDSLIFGASGNLEFKTVNGEYIVGSGDINTTSNLEDSVQLVTTAANDSLVVVDGANVVHFNIAGDPGTQTTLALVLPGTAHLSNELDVFFSDDVTTLAITSTGGTTVYSPTAIVSASAGDVIRFKRIGTVYFRIP